MSKARAIIVSVAAGALLSNPGCGGASRDFESGIAEAAKAAEKGKASVKPEPPRKGRSARPTGKLADDDTF